MNLKYDIAFILEAEKLKSVYRQALVKYDRNRFENTAEHTWHTMITAYTLKDYFENLDFDLNQAIKMLLIHDMVEIDAGDTFAYSKQEILSQQQNKEAHAAQRIFNIPNKVLGKEFLSLWHEFNEATTDTAIFANAIDRITPFILNAENDGGTWRNHSISCTKIRQRNAKLKIISPKLWMYLENEIQKAISKGWLTKEI